MTRKSRKQKKASKRAKPVRLTPELVADCVHFGIDRFIRASSTVQQLRQELPADDARQPLLSKVREGFDEKLAIALRDAMFVRRLAKTTDSLEMLVSTVGDALSGADDLPELLKIFEQRFAEPIDLASNSSDTFYFHFAETVIRLVQHLEELCTSHPERFRLLARELPYWPMLVFRHKAANNHLFEKSADGQTPLAELIDLGSDCPINVSNRANYSLKTPINQFLWDILRELHWGRSWVRSIRSGKLQRDCPEQTDLELLSERGHISREEAAIHFRAFALPPLDKETSPQWTDDVVMPWIKLKHLDLRQLTVFAKLKIGPHGRRYAVVRKAVLRALSNITREHGAGWA